MRTVAVPLEGDLLAEAFPNPSAATVGIMVRLRTDQAGPASLELLDAVGRQLSQQLALLSAGTTTLPLAGAAQLATGVYVLRVRQGSRQQLLKLVRE